MEKQLSFKNRKGELEAWSSFFSAAISIIKGRGSGEGQIQAELLLTFAVNAQALGGLLPFSQVMLSSFVGNTGNSPLGGKQDRSFKKKGSSGSPGTLESAFTCLFVLPPGVGQ